MERCRNERIAAVAAILSTACAADFGPTGQYLACGPDGACAEGYACVDAPRLGPVCADAAQRARLCDHPEQCNGMDDNCNGEVDERVADCCATGAMRVCGSTTTPECQGMQACNDHRWGECQFPRTSSTSCSTERCDAGDPFNPWRVILGQSCTVGRGTCERSGVYACAPNGVGVVCDARPGQPSAEICDGTDNDCDGMVDEDIPPVTEGSNRPPCKPRISVCLNGRMQDIQPRFDGGPEQCNGIDDDCDGQTDEPTVPGGRFDAGMNRWFLDDDFERMQIVPWRMRGDASAAPTISTTRAFSGTRSLLLRSAGGGVQSLIVGQVPFEGCFAAATFSAHVYVALWDQPTADLYLPLLLFEPGGYFTFLDAARGSFTRYDASSFGFTHALPIGRWAQLRVELTETTYRLIVEDIAVGGIRGGRARGMELGVFQASGGVGRTEVYVDDLHFEGRP